MNRRRLTLVCLLVMLGLTACVQNGIYNLKLILGGDLVIPAGDVEASDVFLLDGSLTLPDGAAIKGNIYQVMGKLEIAGVVEGDVLQFGGEMTLDPRAQILGNLQIGGGNRQGVSDEIIRGKIIQSQVRVPLSPEWFAEDFSRGLYWSLGQIVLLTVVSIILAAAFPVPLDRVRMAIAGHPLVSIAMGTLVLIVGLSLVVQMIFTILLIPVSILGLALFGIAIGFGWAGFGMLVGNWLAGRLRAGWSRPVIAGLGTLVFMILMNISGLFPVIGEVISIGTAITGLGAVFLTRFGVRQFVPAAIDP